jgi:hypothetical protein
MGKAARVRVRDRYSAERLADDLADLYRDLLTRATDRRSSLSGSTRGAR